jgi:hypothetical protein
MDGIPDSLLLSLLDSHLSVRDEAMCDKCWFAVRLRSLVAIIWVLLLCSPVHAEQLAPEFEMERLLILAGQQMAARNFDGVRHTLQTMDSLVGELPPDYHYYQALVAREDGRSAEARDSLARYVNQAGRKGAFYQEALAAISDLDSQVAARSVATPVVIAENALPEIESAERETWEQQLMALYLVDSAPEALLEHINAILAAHVYVPSKIKDLSRRQGVHYQLSTGEGGVILVQETHYADDGKAGFTSNRVPVFGVNPYLRSACEFERSLCWVAHPARPDEQWLTIAADQTALHELTRSLGYLIRSLQG